MGVNIGAMLWQVPDPVLGYHSVGEHMLLLFSSPHGNEEAWGTAPQGQTD